MPAKKRSARFFQRPVEKKVFHSRALSKLNCPVHSKLRDYVVELAKQVLIVFERTNASNSADTGRTDDRSCKGRSDRRLTAI